MKVLEKLKTLIWRPPLTEEELAARAHLERKQEAAEFALRDRGNYPL
jgi:hypothetical protein